MLSGRLITDVIECAAMKPGALIKNRRLERGLSQAELARLIGTSQPAIRKIESGETEKSKYLPKISEVLEIPLPDLDATLQRSASSAVNPARLRPSQNRNEQLRQIPAAELIGNVDLPVHSIVQGGTGALILSSDPFTYQGRPHHLLGINGAYGVLVNGNSMAREYNEGDIAYVNPHLRPRQGDPCIFQGTREDGAVEAVIKYLERSPDASETVWYVFQTNPSKKFTLKKVDWQLCHVCVGKQSGR